MNVIMTTVKNVVIYLILLTVVMNLLGNSNFKKYIGIFTGMILIIIAITPLLGLMKLDKNLDYYLDVDRFIGDTQNMNTELSIADEQQKAIILAEYKQELRQQITDLLAEMDVALQDFEATVVEDQNQEGYGFIEQIRLTISQRNTNKEVVEKQIERVHIDQITISEAEKPEKEYQQRDSAMGSLVRDEIAKRYELDKSQIIVEIQEN